jgi:RND family efflux transporter MFP subunit
MAETTANVQNHAKPTGPVQDRNKIGRKVRLYAWLLLILALVLAAWGITSRLVSRSHLRDRTAADAVLAVETARPTLSMGGDAVVLPGTAQGYVEAALYARTSGYLRAWYTDIGAHVHKGQLLAVIETPEVDRQLAQGRQDLATAETNLALARLTNDRWQKLLATKTVSQQDADTRAADFAAMTTTAKSAAENVARLRDLESYKRVLAPFDGVVTARNTDVGALINAGQAAGSELFRVVDTRRLRIYAQVPESYANVIRDGMEAVLTFAEKPGTAYHAVAARTSNALDPTARTLQVELQLDNRDGALFPGAYAQVHFKLPAKTETMRLPANTVLFRAAGLQVATVDAGRHVKLKTIVEGRDFGKTIEVLSGIDLNDEVILNPSDSILDGDAVRRAQKPPAPTQSTGSSS